LFEVCIALFSNAKEFLGEWTGAHATSPGLNSKKIGKKSAHEVVMKVTISTTHQKRNDRKRIARVVFAKEDK
tara:strand:+ start:274 stop:489 length:216 start_codon:yes stop_codon:yes gene_type:complete